MIHSDVLNQERHYNKQPSEENLDNLAGSCLEVIAFLLEGLTKVVNDLGVQAMEMMEVLTSASEEVTTSRDKLIARSANTQDDGAFLNHALLSFEGPQSLALQIERSLHQCLNYQDDLDKLSQSLNVHDESNQILDHRRQDIRLLIGGASRAEVIESIRKNAVTFIEKRLAMHYFEELDGVFGECVETPTLTIFRSG